MTRTLGLLYAAEDGAYADELRAHLRADVLAPLELRLGDAGADPGAAQVLLVLESPALTAAQVALLERAHHRGALLIPVPLRQMESLPVLQHLKRCPDGGGTAILGAARPGEHPAVRDGAWVTVARGLGPALAARASSSSSWSSGSAASVGRRSTRDPRAALTIAARRDGDRLMLRYLRPGPRGLGLCHQATTAWPATLPGLADTPADGARLFRLLFPDEAWRPALQAACDLKTAAAATPARPVALRLLSSEPVLDSVALHALRWGDYRLRDYGWTFERGPLVQTGEAADGHPGEPAQLLLLPARALVVGATAEAGDLDGRTPGEGRALTEVIEALSGVLRRRSDGALTLGLATAGRPAIEALAGLGEPAAELLLVLGPAPGLAALLGALARPPLLCYADAPLGAAELAALRRAVPVVLAGPGQRELLLRFLRRLPHEPDAVAALYAAARGAQRDAEARDLRAADPWRALPTAYTSGPLLIEAPQRPRLEGSPWLKLDREEQRAIGVSLVRKAINSERRVEALVLLGEAGNHIDEFVNQLRSELPGDLHALDTVPMGWPEPDGGAPLGERLRTQAVQDLTGRSDGSLHKALADQLRLGPRPQLLILDYQTLDPNAARLNSTDLFAWLRHCRNLSLPEHCPEGLRILCVLALQVPTDKHDKLIKLLSGQINLLSPRFGHTRLVLGGITAEHLLNFLNDKDHCDCPREQEHEFAELIMKVTNGNYEAAVGLLRRAMHEVTWSRLKHELRDAVTGHGLDTEDLL